MKAWCGELLEEHLTRVGDVAYGAASGEAVVKEMRSVHVAVAKRLGIDVEAARRLVAVAAFLHDVGKAGEPYQQLIELYEGRGCRGLSLAGYEAWSAYVVYYTAYYSFSPELAATAAWAALTQNQPKRPVDDIIVEGSKRKPALTDVEYIFSLAEKGAARYGAVYDVRSEAVARYEYLARRDFLQMLNELKKAAGKKDLLPAAELVKYAVALSHV